MILGREVQGLIVWEKKLKIINLEKNLLFHTLVFNFRSPHENQLLGFISREELRVVWLKNNVVYKRLNP